MLSGRRGSLRIDRDRSRDKALGVRVKLQLRDTKKFPVRVENPIHLDFSGWQADTHVRFPPTLITRQLTKKKQYVQDFRLRHSTSKKPTQNQSLLSQDLEPTSQIRTSPEGLPSLNAQSLPCAAALAKEFQFSRPSDSREPRQVPDPLSSPPFPPAPTTTQFTMSSQAQPTVKKFGKSTRAVPQPSEKAQKWYPAVDEAQPKKVRWKNKKKQKIKNRAKGLVKGQNYLDACQKVGGQDGGLWPSLCVA